MDIMNITDSAKMQISHLKKTNKDNLLKISVQGGGCSGFQYDIDLIDIKTVTIINDNENDKIDNMDDDDWDSDSDTDNKIMCIRIKDTDILLEKNSIKYIKGSTLDYLNTGFEERFDVINPNAKSGCGCGISFTPKDIFGK